MIILVKFLESFFKKYLKIFKYFENYKLLKHYAGAILKYFTRLSKL